MAAPVEAKVKAASAATLLAGLAVALLNAIVADSSLLGPLPSWMQAPLLALAPAALTWLAGYQAKHTVRDVADPIQGR
ncbi:holin [Streptomyces sp. NPDC056921]|uniref:holin n=1 Tax=Streptomyces sp. NPDC056921 TaxID=3345966 RepID=UPI00362BB206